MNYPSTRKYILAINSPIGGHNMSNLVLHNEALVTDSQNKIIVTGDSPPGVTRDEEYSFFAGASWNGANYELFHLPPLTVGEMSTFAVELNNYSTLIGAFPDLSVAILTFDLAFQSSTVLPLTHIGNGIFAFDTQTSLSTLMSRAYFIRLSNDINTSYSSAYVGAGGNFYGTHPIMADPLDFLENAEDAGVALFPGCNAINANRTGSYVDY
jgi:hypothetical protein